METGKPITPEEVGEAKIGNIPAYVFDAFNELIATGFTAGRAVVKQDKAVERILEKCTDKAISRHDLFERGWLNVEEAYRAAGWKVEYDKPAYNEDYPATFTFSKKK